MAASANKSLAAKSPRTADKGHLNSTTKETNSHSPHYEPKTNGKKASLNIRRLDNPLFDTEPKPDPMPVEDENPMYNKKPVEKSAAPAREKEESRITMSTEDEKISVLEIVADLEKQLDIAFSIKEAQADEIDKLKKQLKEAREKIGEDKDATHELESLLMSQEELNSKLEFLENERLKASEEIKNLQQELQQNSGKLHDTEKTREMVNEEKHSLLERIEYVETQLDEAKSMVQTLQSQNTVLKNEKAALTRKCDSQIEERDDAVAEKERAQKELEKARESLDEIRMMLAQTKAKARGQSLRPHG